MRTAASDGLNREFEALYAGLRFRALQFLNREFHAQSMSPTLLLHEAYLVLAHSRTFEIQNARHMTSIAARVMRNLLIDRARARKALINGGALQQVELNEALIPTDEDADRILAVAEAMERLAAMSVPLARLVELRYFCGFTEKEVGTMTGVSERSVKRQWSIAKVRLFELLQGQTVPAPC
jgi:RNA polymerase sigma factor (TIGR02999 family)